MAFGRSTTKVAPSKYPKVLFHGLRSAQLLASVVVGAVMFYFIYHLNHDHWQIPWTFIFFTVASLFTIIALCVTIVMHCCIGLNPRLNLTINSTLWAVWAAAFGMLWWWASKTIFNKCDVEHWSGETGIMVCRIYKTLFAFGMLGFASTTLALALDLYVFKKATRLGKYNAMQDLDNKRTTAAFHDGDSQENLAGLNAQENRRPGQAGYALPEEQFDDDTSYRGHHL
ncbi:hypothetical protein EJ08DRAFT_698434 [Tothia fuscella]|uniref:MARVEL domain-containing protein n=1 Tax=Tothia fuscella TaxID=1048955 RepID=A0A9P4NNU0_9PEZI|nr:hypothetical protein EJ08DRAFT_698434 [Tothia fuscella]